MGESGRKVAQEIAKRYTREGAGYADRLYQLAYAIEAALKERDERAAKIADAVESEWVENARNVARADNLVGGLAQSTYTSYAEVANKIAAAIRNEDTGGLPK